MSVAIDGAAVAAAAVHAVVVTYDSASTIDDCLARLRAAAGIGSIRVVDNASSDGTLEIIQRHASADPRVRFIANPDNPGFSVACNQGMRDGAGQARWVAFVNPDCLVEQDTFVRLCALAAPYQDVLLGADLVGEDGVRDPAARRRDPDFAAMLAATFASGASASSMVVAADDALALQPVQAISGALMLASRPLLERLGGFDEHYRLHAEDLDLCRRAREAGAFIAVANAVRVVHVRGVSSRSRPLFVEWHKHRGLWRYFRKFEAPSRPRWLWPVVFAAIWLRFPLAASRRLLLARD